jgi:hypothetical protein
VLGIIDKGRFERQSILQRDKLGELQELSDGDVF